MERTYERLIAARGDRRWGCARFNASGVFDSPFSKRVGISTSHFAEEAAPDPAQPEAG